MNTKHKMPKSDANLKEAFRVRDFFYQRHFSLFEANFKTLAYYLSIPLCVYGIIMKRKKTLHSYPFKIF